jgi:AcrR family transcriptional regulator
MATNTELERSPERRLLAAARRLFYRHGIGVTGVAELCAAAGVSKRTLYELYGSKDGLVAAYLAELAERPTPLEEPLDRDDLTPRQRLLALFDRPTRPGLRGCPFHNAGVELPAADHPARATIRAHKEAFRADLARTARAAGAADPDGLAGQLLVLFEGANALLATLGAAAAFDPAHAAADVLLAAAIR